MVCDSGCDSAHFMAKSNENLILDLVCLFKDKSLHLKTLMCHGEELLQVPSYN